MNKLILGIETSCDETAAAVINEKGEILSDVVYSQIDLHSKFGGIVPEIASRDHAAKIDLVVGNAIDKAGVKKQDLTHIAVTTGPGLIGCLLVGVSFAKAFAYSLNIPVISIDHVKAHLMAVFIEHGTRSQQEIKYPFIGLVVSGGHTSIYLVNSYNDISIVGVTVDDAAGETLDKVARFIGLGYPGGKIIQDMSEGRDISFVKFPKPVVKGNELDFSFSGLKTAVINYLKNNRFSEDIIASFQYTLCETLVERVLLAAKKYNVHDVVIGGGVAANKVLRNMLAERASKMGKKAWVIPIKYCTDNASMIANLARFYADQNDFITGFTKTMFSYKTYSTSRK